MYLGRCIKVIIPALNEEDALPKVLGAIPGWVDETIVVDNGSRDATAAVAERGGARLVCEPRRGYGAACLAGIAAAGDTDILVFVDADFSDYPQQMDRLVGPIASAAADLVIGSRTLGRAERGALTPAQRWGNKLACFLMRWLWGHAYSDLGPFRAIRASALESLRMNDLTYGWTVQMQARALRAGLRVVEVPVDYRRRIGRSKISGTVRGVVCAGTKILATIARERFQPPPISSYSVCPDHVIVFSRYPEPGKSKTRLIPALGDLAAAQLHQAMTEHALLTLDRLCFTRHASVEVRFTGGDRAAMADLFGNHRRYFVQRGGDLGSRLNNAVTDAVDRGAQRVIVIGTDCPAISVSQLSAAFDALKSNDCVIGPARDGGYYLIGLRRACPQLFENIAWGTGQVRDQTLRAAASDGLSVYELTTLADVDDGQDLSEWDRFRSPRITVVIPTLNEAQYVKRTIEHARSAVDVEFLVADGGSLDETTQIAESAGARVVLAPRGRARQMNAGAAVARGRILIFVHADTLLPQGYADIVERLLSRSDAIVAAFALSVDHPRKAFRRLERLVNFRSRRLGLPYGDQALAVRATDFYRLGGFADLPFMEDYEFVNRAKRHGRIVIANAPVKTSARRWLRTGILRLSVINQACVLGYHIGVSPARLATWRGGRGKRYDEGSALQTTDDLNPRGKSVASALTWSELKAAGPWIDSPEMIESERIEK